MQKRICSGNDNIFLGQFAGGGGDVTGSNNVALGCSAGFSLTSGGANVFLGYLAGYNNQTGCCNIAIGYEAGRCATDRRDNISIGMRALKCNTGCFNISMGFCGGYTGAPSY